jgi:hypothetical protein
MFPVRLLQIATGVDEFLILAVADFKSVDEEIVELIAAVQTGMAKVPATQEKPAARGGWAARAFNPTPETADRLPLAFRTDSVNPQADGAKVKLTGTWFVNIPATPEAAAFNALQTYSDDGTMTETSDLLAQLGEGPAHGVWSGKKNDYLVTFQLFIFDENRQPAGRVRVRVAVHLNSDDQLTGLAVVDLILPDSTEINSIDNTPFTGTRIKVLPPQ